VYEALDNFMNNETWHTTHPLDEGRFYQSLNKIVWSSDFNADQMATYMRKKVGSTDDRPIFEEAINRYCTNAWAVREFIRTTGLSKA
jgi:hypothetical protein